jgi:hypothetical protein
LSTEFSTQEKKFPEAFSIKTESLSDFFGVTFLSAIKKIPRVLLTAYFFEGGANESTLNRGNHTNLIANS